MGTLTVYNRSNITGENIRINNSPGDNGESYLDRMLDNGFIVSETTTYLTYWEVLLTTVIEYDGHTFQVKYIKNTYGDDTLKSYLITVDGQTYVLHENIDLLWRDYVFYEGDELTSKVFAKDDSIYGTNISDVIWGYDGNDYLYGNGGNDELVGGSGTDFLFGGSGDDVLIGGVGINSGAGWDNDYYYGGSGHDIMENNWAVMIF